MALLIADVRRQARVPYSHSHRAFIRGALLKSRARRTDQQQGEQDMRIFITAVTAVALCAGCAVSSGVAKVGPDTFTITTSASPGRGGVPAAKRAAYEEAGAECSRRGALELFVLNETFSPPTWTEGMAIATVNFRCLNANDAEFQRQRLTKP